MPIYRNAGLRCQGQRGFAPLYPHSSFPFYFAGLINSTTCVSETESVYYTTHKPDDVQYSKPRFLGKWNYVHCRLQVVHQSVAGCVCIKNIYICRLIYKAWCMVAGEAPDTSGPQWLSHFLKRAQQCCTEPTAPPLLFVDGIFVLSFSQKDCSSSV